MLSKNESKLGEQKMSVPTQIKNRLVHYKKQILLLAATKVISVVAICQMLAISRNTFYKYKEQQRQGLLGYFNCAPLHHGMAKSQEIVDQGFITPLLGDAVLTTDKS